MELFDVYFEVLIDEIVVMKFTMRAPADAIIAHFVDTARQIKNDPRHMKLRVVRPELIWDQIDREHRVLENCIEIQNY